MQSVPTARAAEQFGLFAKYWRPGDVKTRLAATIGRHAASELYRCFVETLLRRFSEVGDVRVLAYSPPDRRDEFAALAGDRWLLETQRGADLGERIRNYFDAAFAGGAERVVLIGSDSPDLSVELVEQAFHRLTSQPVVLGPATDGGYYLIGAAEQTPPVFEGIDWSSARVWRQTVQQLQQAKIDFAQLPLWSDVDDEADLRRLQRELSSSAHPDETLQREVERALAGHARRAR